MIDFFERYAHRIVPEPNSGCWLWTGAVAAIGYGHGHRDMQHFYAHRAAYEAANGIGSANGYVVRHRCDNPPCVNPDHLEIGTQYDNTMDSIRRGRGNRARGERAPTARLTEQQVKDIRRLFSTGMTVQKIRETLSLTHLKWDTVRKAADGTCWRHL